MPRSTTIEDLLAILLASCSLVGCSELRTRPPAIHWVPFPAAIQLRNSRISRS